MAEKKVYLGDAVYARFDGYAIVLTTEDGLSTTNTIVLEPEVYAYLAEFARTLWSSGSDRSKEKP